MIRRSFAVLISLLILAGCVSTTPSGGAGLPTLPEIATPTTAKRALVIAEAIRVAARGSLARYVTADGQINADERLQLQKFDVRDREFTTAWAQAQQAVTLWSVVAGSRPATFDDAYAVLLQLSAQWQTQETTR